MARYLAVSERNFKGSVLPFKTVAFFLNVSHE